MKEKEGFYYPCSENKGADQLRGYCEAGLCLCVPICRLLVFLCSGSNHGPRTVFQDKPELKPLSRTYCDKAGNYAVPNV